jgi:hypothetical protein
MFFFQTEINLCADRKNRILQSEMYFITTHEFSAMKMAHILVALLHRLELFGTEQLF